MRRITNDLRSITALIFISTLGLGAACATDDAEQACGGNGELHGDHCHCDSGYVLSKDEQSCLPAGTGGDDGDDADTAEPTGTGGGATDTTGADSEGTDSDAEEALTFTPEEVRAFTEVVDTKRVWVLEAIEDTRVLNLEIYEAFGGPTAPTTVPLTAAETDYATCGTCLLFRDGCEAHDDHFHCGRAWMPEVGGAITLTALGTSAGSLFAGEIDGVTLREVTIAEDFTTTPVPGGETIVLETWSFEATLASESSGEAECGGHGHEHDDQCHCDPGYMTDPQDPLNCVPV
ncbi:hypothetical protein [Nannocystis punicea]|uniref:EGF-like domain-containing protein n=1 Tax=Nannocystis punicea TaxID=2995304 RepID=A0ABY7GY15_9BACT|nr:hypothetical protein [Nannocystis poenicansa]WAS91871.1 hypothetical protein O0S08_37290 [Nannocystis poenicansa]